MPIIPPTSRTAPQSLDIAVVSALTQSVGSAARQDLDSVLTMIDAALANEISNRESSGASETAQLKITATGSSAQVSVGSSFASRIDGTQLNLTNGTLMSDFTGATLNFANGSFTGNVNAFTLINFAGQASKYSKYALVLTATHPDFVSVIPGTSFYTTLAAALADSSTPSITGGIPIGEVIVQDDGSAGTGTITSITQGQVIQFKLGGGSSSTPVTPTGEAHEVALTIATTSRVVTLANPQPNTSYVVIAQIVNTTDPNPQYIPVDIVNKTLTTFTVKWNTPLPTGAYFLDYMIPLGVVQIMAGEFSMTSLSSGGTVTIPIPQPGLNYVVIMTLANYTDPNPQYQPITVTAKTTTTFSFKVNAPVPTGNYRAAWVVAAYQ